MTIRINLLFLVNFLVAAAFSPAFAAAGGTINGMVFDDARRGVVDIDVELQDEYSRFLARTRSTGGGRFQFTNLAPGVYVVRIVGGRLGFADQSRQVEIVNFSRGASGASSDNVYVEVYLRPLRAATWAETVGVGTSVFVQEVPENALRLYREALAAIARKDDAGAVGKLQQALGYFPDYFDALVRLADEMLKARNFKAAPPLLDRAVKVNPRAADAWYMLGYAKYMLLDFKGATDALRVSVNHSARSAAAFLLLGMSLRQQRDFVGAEKEMLESDALTKQKSPDVQWQLALLYGNDLKRYKEAADRLELFLKLQPESKDRAKIEKLVQEFRKKVG